MENKKDYRKRQFTFSDEERAMLKERAYAFTTQVNIAKVFKTSKENVNIAFAGGNMKLMAKIKSYIEKMEMKRAA